MESHWTFFLTVINVKWLLCDSLACVNGVCVCVGETASLLTLGVSAEKQIVLLTLRQTSAVPPTLPTAIERSCVCLSWYLWGLEPSHSLFITEVCVWMLKRPFWDRENTTVYTSSSLLVPYCDIVLLSGWILFGTRRFKFPSQHNK